jgi:hypothetical protein
MATLTKIHKDGRKEFKEQGARVEAIEWNENGTFKSVLSNIPVKGCSMLVGSVTARSYSAQDYWLTTTISEILESNIDEEGRPISFLFLTENGSTYELTY